jgi:hypothetical protein
MSSPNTLSPGHHRSVSNVSEPGSRRVSDVSSEHHQSSGVPDHGPHAIPVSRYANGQKNPVSSSVQESPSLTSLPRYNESNGHKKSVSLNKPLPHFGYAPIQTSNPARESKEYTNIPNWPRASVTLGKTTGDIILHMLHDLFMLIVPIPFFVLAGIVIRKNGQLVDDHDWHKITTATKLVWSLFRLTANTDVPGGHNLSHRICCCCRKSYQSICLLEIGARSPPWLHRTITWKPNLLWNFHHPIFHEIVQPCRSWSVVVLVSIPTWRPVLPPHHYNFL